MDKTAGMSLELKGIKIPLRTIIKTYLKRAQEIESYLSKRPNEWEKFQSGFNAELNIVFRNIMDFEKINLAIGREDKVYKLKQIFINKFRNIFARGEYVAWSLRKPFGYAGDFKIIDDIYQNCPTTTGFDRLFDNYTQMSAIAVAVRNRKEDFKRLIVGFIKERQGCKLRVMNLASGPCRELEEILSSDAQLYEKVIFDCYDNEEKAIEYAKSLLNSYSNIDFIKLNAIRIALTKNINYLIDKKYDLIYSTGFFDYLSDRIAIAVVRNLKKLLKPDGMLVISNVRDKYSNPSVHFMEWAADWNLVYREDGDFRKIFIDAGYKEDDLEAQYEQQRIMQYITATHKQR